MAYFCAEFGVAGELPLYAGGLGILAGDTLKEASDMGYPMVGVGLLYRGGMAKQELTTEGEQVEKDISFDPVAIGLEHVYLPHEEERPLPLFVRVHLTKVDVWVRVWKKSVGKVDLYLLDTDTDQNEPSERGICRALYYGSEEAIIKQQMILGIGGIKVLKALEIHPRIYHINEGRPAFLFWQLIRQIMSVSGYSYDEAAKRAKSMIVYTNHTLVRAGNQDYDADLLKQYSRYYAEKIGISLEKLLAPGIEKTTRKFSLTLFALNAAAKASAVSVPHYELSRNIWPEFSWVNVTNGVHLPTWQDPAINIAEMQGDELWRLHQINKEKLGVFAKQRTGFSFDPNRLVVVWARRVAGYKRLMNIFDEVETLKCILANESRPIQLIVAGKAHATDAAAKQIIKDVISLMKTDLAGLALFIPNYDMETARHLTRGADVWLNTPYQGQEASGTSGMKAIANGVLQCTVPEGWAAEVDWYQVGWTLDSTHLAKTLYYRLEQDIAPLFYARNDHGVSPDWLAMMKRSVLLAKDFSTTRMLAEYQQKLYQ